MNQCRCQAIAANRAELERIKKIARMAQDELNMGYPDHTFVVRNVSDHTGYKIRVTLLYAPFDLFTEECPIAQVRPEQLAGSYEDYQMERQAILTASAWSTMEQVYQCLRRYGRLGYIDFEIMMIIRPDPDAADMYVLPI